MGAFYAIISEPDTWRRLLGILPILTVLVIASSLTISVSGSGHERGSIIFIGYSSQGDLIGYACDGTVTVGVGGRVYRTLVYYPLSGFSTIIREGYPLEGTAAVGMSFCDYTHEVPAETVIVNVGGHSVVYVLSSCYRTNTLLDAGVIVAGGVPECEAPMGVYVVSDGGSGWSYGALKPLLYASVLAYAISAPLVFSVGGGLYNVVRLVEYYGFDGPLAASIIYFVLTSSAAASVLLGFAAIVKLAGIVVGYASPIVIGLFTPESVLASVAAPSVYVALITYIVMRRVSSPAGTI